jgi:predicted Zn finger-like uncharacterized protein
MSSIDYTCPACQAVIPVTRHILPGSPVRCPECDHFFKAPARTVGTVDPVPAVEAPRPKPPAPERPQRRGLRTALLVGALLTVSAAAGGSFTLLGGFSLQLGEPRKFTSEEGGFSVRLPGEPRMETESVATVSGKSTATTYLLEPFLADVHYGVGFLDTAAADPSQISVTAAFTGARVGLRRRLPSDAKVVNEQQIRFGPYPGREWELSLPGKGKAFVRCYLVEKRVYQLMIVGKKLTASSKAVEDFFDSFELAGVSRGPDATGSEPQFPPEETVTLYVSNVPYPAALELALKRLRALLPGRHVLKADNRDCISVVTLAPWRDVSELVARIDAGEATQVGEREIHVLAPTIEVQRADAAVVEPALADLRHAEAGKRRLAAEELAGVAPDKRRAAVAQILDGLLKDGDVGVRAAAAHALAAWGSTADVPALIRVLNDPDPQPRQQAIQSLVRLRDPRALDPIVQRLLDAADREEAVRALPTWGRAVEARVLRLIGHRDMGVRIAVCKVLKQVGTIESLPALDQLARSKDGSWMVAGQAGEAIRGRTQWKTK